MTDDRLPGRSRTPSAIRRTAPWLLIIPSAIIGIVLVELFCRLFVPSIGNTESVFKPLRRVMFFDGRDAIFRNHEEIFTFVRHDEVRNLAAFLTDDGFTVEYDYRFRTNNLGLVQDADIVPERPSLLLLGDSFTEGLGAEPWFRLLSPAIDELGYQPINGGLLGTGFDQWLKLERYLTARNFQIRKLVVVFISDDYHRPFGNREPGELRCLTAVALCDPGESFFYRLPPPGELSSFIGKVRAARAPMMGSWIGTRAAALLPASFQVYRYFNDRLENPSAIARLAYAEQQSLAAIAELIKIHGPDNVVFIHIPQKDEIATGPDSLGATARRAIEAAGGRVFDGFKLCRLTAADYYP